MSTRAAKASSNCDGTRRSVAFYVWVLVVIAIAGMGVVLSWHAKGGPTDPTALAPGEHLSRTTAVIDSAILVFREGLETILVLAAITASFLGANKVYRRPVAAGGAVAVLAAIGTWFLAIWVIGAFGGRGLDVQAATGIPAIIVLLVVMNWFFHRVYWTGWISHHNKRRRKLIGGGRTGAQGATDVDARRRINPTMAGLALLGFTSVYREGFEIVIFLQNLRVAFGDSVVLEGVVLGALATAAVGVLTFGLHQRLPYKRLLIITGLMLLVVLFVMVGEEVNEMQLAGWIASTDISWLHFPGWAGTWFSLFANVQTIVAQVLAVSIVLGSYLGAQYIRVWRPRRRGKAGARIAVRPPEPAHAVRRAEGVHAPQLG